MNPQPLTVLAQELRNPIGAIRSAVSVMESAGTLPGAMDQARRVITRQVGHLSLLVDDLLDLASLARGTLNLRREWIDVVQEVEAAVEASAWAVIGSGHSLCVDVPDMPLHAYVDGTRLRQVVTNLLHNACKHTQPLGRIRLTLQHIDDCIVCSVEDNGVGIASDHLPYVFDVFTRSCADSADAPRGTGIGLALVREIVELHGGHVQAKSFGAGHGSVFLVRLPVCAQPALAQEI